MYEPEFYHAVYTDQSMPSEHMAEMDGQGIPGMLHHLLVSLHWKGHGNDQKST